jgi:hypothetical protein
MRWILPFMLMLVGCVATLPGDDSLVGDGTVRVKCQPCDGTGKVK